MPFAITLEELYAAQSRLKRYEAQHAELLRMVQGWKLRCGSAPQQSEAASVWTECIRGVEAALEKEA